MIERRSPLITAPGNWNQCGASEGEVLPYFQYTVPDGKGEGYEMTTVAGPAPPVSVKS